VATQLFALFPLASKAMERMAKDADKLTGTPLESTMTIEGVKSPEQMTEPQQGGGGGGGIGGMLGRKIMKPKEQKPRSTIMTSHNVVLEVSKAVADTDLAVPADFKLKK
jgi:hypothetical protein